MSTSLEITSIIFALKATFNLQKRQGNAIIMQSILKSATIIVALCAILALATVASAQTTVPEDHVIHATGTGNVIATPDRAQVTFSVQTEDADVQVAQQENAAQMSKVFDALEKAGVPSDALKTTGYSIYPVYDDSNTILSQKVKSYQVTNTLTVTLHDVNMTGTVIDTAVANGINQASSIQFMLSDEQAQALRTQALVKAVAQARTDADAVATALGTNITGVKTADITNSYVPVAFDNYQMNSIAGKAAVPTPIQPGDITVTAQVTVTYSIA